MEFVPVHSFNNYVEAHIAMGNLEQQHINCWLKDEYTVTIDPILANAVGGIKLMVAKVQVPRALEILQKATEKKNEDFACPHCGSRDIQTVTTPSKKRSWFLSLLSRLIGGNIALPRQTWHCYACSKNCEAPNEMISETIADAR